MLVNYEGPNDGVPGLDKARFPESPYGFLAWVNTDADYYPGADRAWALARGRGGFFTLWNHKNGIVFAAAGLENRRPSSRGIPHILEEHLKK